MRSRELILFLLKRAFIFFSFFLFFCFSGFYIYYLYKYNSFSPSNRDQFFKIYPKNIILKTGIALNSKEDRIQHFLNFPFEKDSNTIRIGTFGDSHTYGDEVDKTETYPYQLQQMFHTIYPDKKVEILNFGKGGEAFANQFFLWESYHKKYSLDYILFGPKGLYYDRDSTFSLFWDYKLSHPPKHRFILSENNTAVKEVHIKGDTLLERYKNYYKLIPSRTALLYDKKAFKIWELFLPFLRNKIYNPFYYTKIPEKEEIAKINKILLKKIQKEYDKKILVFSFHQDTLLKTYKSVQKNYNFNTIDIVDLFKLFYRVYSHSSSLGNEYIAKIYFNALIGKEDFSLNYITCSFIAEKGSFKNEFKGDLDFIQSLKVIHKKTVLGSLRTNSHDHYHGYNKDGSYKNYKIKNTKYLISFSNTNSFLDSVFFPIEISLNKNWDISIKFKNKETLIIGKAIPLDSHDKTLMFYTPYVYNQNDWDKKRRSRRITFFLIEDMPLHLKRKVEDIDYPLDIFIGNYKIGLLHPQLFYNKPAFYFEPVKGYEHSFLMMGSGNSSVREKDLPSEFSSSIEYVMEDGTSFKSAIPSWKCRKEKQNFQFKLPNFQPLSLN